MTNQYEIPGGELCTICGLRFYNRSAGGPGICPSCDCGFFGPGAIEAQRKEIERLNALLNRQIEINTDLDKQITDLVLKRRADEPSASPTSVLYTTRQYPCGCRAEGSGDVPSYCSEHGSPERTSDAP
jgi:hypothetical protein